MSASIDPRRAARAINASIDPRRAARAINARIDPRRAARVINARIDPRRAARAINARIDPRRVAPVVIAGVSATVYVIVSPPSLDLAAHLFRARLFQLEGFGIWDNFWYAGHHTPGYSVLFPAVAAALSPQLTAGIAATATAALFEPLARRRFGPDAWLGSAWFAAATTTDLFTGRLAFAFGLLPAVGAALALQRGRSWLAAGLGVVAALASPVAALFAALAGAAYAIGSYLGGRCGAADAPAAHRDNAPAAHRDNAPAAHRDNAPAADRDNAPAAHRDNAPIANRAGETIAGLGLAVASLAPVGLLAIAFPEGGTEPFTFATLWPIPVIAIVALLALPRDAWTLRAGVVLYTLGCIASYSIPTPVGSNAARLGALVAGPLAAIIWWRRRAALLLAAALPLLYIQWQAPVRDVSTATGDPSASSSYYHPLIDFLARQPGPPVRVEIPFTRFHWEAYEVAPRFPLARGWERQLDIKYNQLFYGGRLTPERYDAWLHQVAVGFVAVSDASLDYSARAETALIARGLPFLALVLRTRHWRVYAVQDPTPIVQGPASLRAIGPSSLVLDARRPGTSLIRVHFSPYWALAQGTGCVAPAGDYTKLTLRRAGPARLVMRFAIDRIRANSPRCT